MIDNGSTFILTDLFDKVYQNSNQKSTSTRHGLAKGGASNQTTLTTITVYFLVDMRCVA